MAKNRENRYDTALEMAHELNKAAYEGEPTLQKIPALVDRQTDSSPASNRAGWIVAGLILLLALAGGAYAFRGQLPFLSPPVPTLYNNGDPSSCLRDLSAFSDFYS